MTGTWELTPIEFWVAWEALGRDRMPFPLTFAAEVETQVEFDIQRKAAAESLMRTMGDDDSLYTALHALAHADVRIELFGYRHDGRDRMVRACAAIESGNGAVVAQKPGAAFGVGGNIRVDLRPAQAVVQRLLTVLPDTAPGSGPSINIHRDELHRPKRINSYRLSPSEQAVRQLKRPFRTYAELRVATGPSLNGWEEGGTQIYVIDYRDDGRYLIREDERIQAIPATADRLRTEITRLMDQASTTARETAWQH
ncbi:ESX secretion-associated protein EspG [Nocardia sp. XZ_19_385]|uniref:ESX secretion-associated protein EspG n=1 Tax=Nocardia sp. XZ_19_385 TaxID=2769488 RepID=UPI001890B10E|nr:ESX secretion-associated protein EspG [Nocardia sp. XZ_19_385]